MNILPHNRNQVTIKIIKIKWSFIETPFSKHAFIDTQTDVEMHNNTCIVVLI